MYRVQRLFTDLKVEWLLSWAQSLADQFEREGRRDHIDEAIALNRKALERCPPGHPIRLRSLTHLSTCLSDRYSQLGDMKDIEEVIVLGQSALELCPHGHPERSVWLHNLAWNLHTRYEELDAMDDLNKAIALDRDALELRPLGNPLRSMSLSSLAGELQTRYKKLGATEDLEEAIALKQEVLELCPQGHPDYPETSHNLAWDLHARYEKLGDMDDLTMAIALNRDVLELRPQEHPDRSISLHNLAWDLHARSEKFGAIEDLEEAIALNRDALELRPLGHPLRSTSLSSLAGKLHFRYDSLGAIEDLDEAIALNQDALKICPPGHSDYSELLHNLAWGLHARYEKLSALDDLNEAIALNRNVLQLDPQECPGHSMSLNNLARELYVRYEKLGTVDDLDEAITLNRDALDLRPQGHSHRCMPLGNLARGLHSRYEKFGVIKDLDEAIVLNQKALELRPPGHPFRSVALNNLSVCLHALYKKHRVKKDLDDAISLDRNAFHLCPLGSPYRSESLQYLAIHLRTRFKFLCQSQDKEELFNLYAELVNISHTVSSADLSAAKEWISAAEDFQHPSRVLAYETYLRLLVCHLAALPLLPQHLNIVKDLTPSLALDAFTAALDQSPTKAVELLVQGRGVFLSQLARLRSPVNDVIASGPDGKTLGDRFIQLTSLIRKTLASTDTNKHDHVWHLNIELQKVVSDIRGLPDFSHFLLSPLFSHLREAAIDGPVVIMNASKYSCDALIVFFDRDPVHIPLGITRHEVQGMTSELNRLTKLTKEVNDMGKHFAVVMRDLWKNIVSPIVDVLKKNHPPQSRIWWCPTAEFSVLPLHAAGMYRKGQPKFSDLYVSSYTSTLTALVRARQRRPPNSGGETKRFVAIGQAKAAEESELHFISDELTNIEERVAGHARFTRMEGPESSTSRVVDAFGENEWVHMACHGLPNHEKPFESAFCLHDGRLTIERILRCELRNAEFAYLSACHTTVGDKDCLDETIHLASAMQFAGFRSVIGTMWAVDDEQTVKISSRFYENMVDSSGRLDHTRAAYALHKTMRELEGLSFDQRILYVHFGV